MTTKAPIADRRPLAQHASSLRDDPVDRMIADCTATEFVDWLIWRGSAEESDKNTLISNLNEQFKWHRLQGRLDRRPGLAVLAELWGLRAKNSLNWRWPKSE